MSQRKHTLAIAKRFLKVMNWIIDEEVEGTKGVMDFASRIGKHYQNIKPIVDGIRYPTLDDLANLCLVYKIEPNWLLLGIGEMLQGNKSPKMIPTLLEERVEKIEMLLGISEKR